MKLSRSWLQDYVDLSAITDDEISRAITFLGFEVEQVLRTGAPRLDLVVSGRIVTRDKHPNADKLSVCTVDVGPAHGGIRTIVCGAPNCDADNHVPVALPGAVLPGDFVIKEAKVRGQASSGMLCSAKELIDVSGLSDSQQLQACLIPTWALMMGAEGLRQGEVT
jgi:phenylalanyl-tRNA synthetase beta chain